MSPPSAFILLHNDDNLLVCRSRAATGDTVIVDGTPLTLSVSIEVGHKIARRDLKTGDKIIKYGAPIGSMTADAKAGDHIHMHNMQSDYIKTHTREATHG